MSEPENFLSRWSRRKLDAEHEKVAPHADETASAREPQTAEVPAPDTIDASPDKPKKKKEEPEFDLSTLPSIESITAETDIRMFLQKGVPAHLTRAALRRAWTADPNIRDFIEIAENQWDFATGSDLPGFGSLDASADDIRKMVAEVFGEGLKPPVEAEAKTLPGTADPSKPRPLEGTEGLPEQAEMQQEVAATTKDQPALESGSVESLESVVQRNEVNIAMQQSSSAEEYKPLPTRRPHGRALPQ